MAGRETLTHIIIGTDKRHETRLPWNIFVELFLGQIPPPTPGERGPPGNSGEAYTAPDANYNIPPDAALVEIAAITASRVFTLPNIDAFPLARDLVVADFSGLLLPERGVSIAVPPGSGTTIVGTFDNSYSLVGPGMFVRLRRGKSKNAWVVC